MDAIITRGNPETHEDEVYRGYLITYVRPGCFYQVSKEDYRRGISSTRKDAKRWIDLREEGKVR